MPICQNPECNKEFNQNVNCHVSQKYCSPYCRNKVNDEIYRKLNPERYHEIRRKNSQTHYKKVHPVPPEIEAKLMSLAEKQQDLNGFLQLKPNCEVCGSELNLLLHEISYSPLITVTLCRKCHCRLHTKYLKGHTVSPWKQFKDSYKKRES
jgi:hypothetical protein